MISPVCCQYGSLYHVTESPSFFHARSYRATSRRFDLNEAAYIRLMRDGVIRDIVIMSQWTMVFVSVQTPFSTVGSST